MSNKNERQKVDLRQIKSNHIIKNIFNFVLSPKFIGKIDEFLKGNKHFFSLSDKIGIKLENRINQLGDFRNWYYYLKDIYSALNEVAKKIHNDVYQEPQSSFDKRLLDKRKSFGIECIIYVCLLDIVYLTENKKIFNANDLKIQKAKSAEREDIDKVSCKSTIFNIIQGAINRSLNSKNSDLKSSINDIFSELYCGTYVIHEERVDSAIYKVIENHLSKKFPKHREDDKLKYDLCCLIIKILWLKNNNFYRDSIRIHNNKPGDLKQFHLKTFNYDILSQLGLPNFNDINRLPDEYDFNYEALVKHLQKCDDLYLFSCGNGDFDIRAYFGEKLKSAIKNALPTQEQKDEFKKFIEGKSKSKEDTKKEEPIPNREKENSKNIE